MTKCANNEPARVVLTWLGHGLVGFCDLPKTVKIEMFGTAAELTPGTVNLLLDEDAKGEGDELYDICFANFY